MAAAASAKRSSSSSHERRLSHSFKSHGEQRREASDEARLRADFALRLQVASRRSDELSGAPLARSSYNQAARGHLLTTRSAAFYPARLAVFAPLVDGLERPNSFARDASAYERARACSSLVAAGLQPCLPRFVLKTNAAQIASFRVFACLAELNRRLFFACVLARVTSVAFNDESAAIWRRFGLFELRAHYRRRWRRQFLLARRSEWTTRVAIETACLRTCDARARIIAPRCCRRRRRHSRRRRRRRRVRVSVRTSARKWQLRVEMRPDGSEREPLQRLQSERASGRWPNRSSSIVQNGGEHLETFFGCGRHSLCEMVVVLLSCKAASSAREAAFIKS